MTKKGFTGKNPATTENPKLGTVLQDFIDVKQPEPDGATDPMERTDPTPETAPQEFGKIKLVQKKKQPRDQHVQLLFTADQKAKLKRISEATGLSMNEVMGKALDLLDG